MFAELLQSDVVQIQQGKDLEESHRFRQVARLHRLIEFDIHDGFQLDLRFVQGEQRLVETTPFGWITAQLEGRGIDVQIAVDVGGGLKSSADRRRSEGKRVNYLFVFLVFESFLHAIGALLQIDDVVGPLQTGHHTALIE